MKTQLYSSQYCNCSMFAMNNEEVKINNGDNRILSEFHSKFKMHPYNEQWQHFPTKCKIYSCLIRGILI